MNKYTFICLIAILVNIGCEKEYVSRNNPTEATLQTKNGLLALVHGMQAYYSSDGIRALVEGQALTSRELVPVNSYVTQLDLYSGGRTLTNENGAVNRVFSAMYKVKGMAESLLENLPSVTMQRETAVGIEVYAKFYKAITLGVLAQNFEQVIIDNDLDGDGDFADREVALQESIKILNEASQLLIDNTLSDEFSALVVDKNGIDIKNSIYLFLARYNLMVGAYEEAIKNADSVDLTVQSTYQYDTENRNPLYEVWGESATVITSKPAPNMGLGFQGEYSYLQPEVGDKRLEFYLQSTIKNSSNTGYDYYELKGFGSTQTGVVPVYLPDEALLIKSECLVRKSSPNLAEAVRLLNQVRTDGDDLFGVNANLSNWTGNVNDNNAILMEIYKNRCLELYLSGLRLDDNRRFFPNFTPSQSADEQSMRNRNFYPYPLRERNNNPNTPADPNI